MKKLFFILLSFVFTSFVALADEVTFEVSAPKIVAVGEVFQVVFNVNAKSEDFTPPSFEGFDVLAGPSTSRNIQSINGKRSQTISYSYVLMCSSAGDFTILPAEVKVKNKSYKTTPTAIKAIVEQDSQPTSGDSKAQGKKKTTLAADDLFLQVTLSRTDVYKGQPVKATFKLFTRVNISGSTGDKAPSFNGFWVQQLNTENYVWEKETLNNKIYDTRVIAEYLLFPQQAGTLIIEPFKMNIMAQLITETKRSNNPFDNFFGGAPNIQEVRKPISSKELEISVKELPANAPKSFNGAVGDFEMSVQMPPQEIQANSASTYTIEISGTGNLSLIQAPTIELPTSFEKYNVKTTENLRNTTAGVSGYRKFDYPMIARADGDFIIPPIEFTFFNPKLAKYVTLKTEELNLTVTPDANSTSVVSRGLVSGISKEDVKFLGQDIRFIKTGQPNLVKKGTLFMFSTTYFLIVIILIGAFVFALLWLRKMLQDMRNGALVKGKRANKVALQRFYAAKQYMKQDNQKGFYEEMLRALWGYMGNKLNIPVSNLTKENVREELLKKGILHEQVELYISIISDCEYAQYAPSASGKMNDAYLQGVDIISKFESVINR